MVFKITCSIIFYRAYISIFTKVSHNIFLATPALILSNFRTSPLPRCFFKVVSLI